MAPKKSRKRKAPDAGEDGSSKKRVAILQDSAPSHAALFSDTSIPPPATSPEESTGVATTLPGLSDLDYTPNKWDSPHLHRYFELLQDGHFKMKSGATAKYTAPTPKSEHVLDLPAVEGRNFTLVEDAICLVNQDQPDGTTIKVWKIPIRNMTAEELQFDAFMVPGWATPLKCPSCKKKQVKCNKKRPCDKCSKDPVDAAECVKAKHEVADHRWLTESACSSENISKIVQLGQLVAQILNRVPFEPDVDIWTGRRQPDVRALVPPQKRFVELVSIIEWKRRHFQELDFDRIPPHPAPWSDKTHTYRFFGRAAFGGPPVLQWRKQSYGTQPRSLIWSGKDGQHANFLTLSPANFDASQRETPSEDHLDDYQFFGQYFDGAPDDCNNKDLVTEAKTDSKTASMLRAFQQGLFALVGHVGEWTAINSTWHEHTSAYQSKAGTKGAMLDGPLNGGLLLKKPNAITNALYFGQSWHALLAKPFTHAAIPKVDDRACLSYAMSTTLDAFEAGKSFPWITFTLYRALYELESGIVTRDMVIEQALTSFDSADPDNASRWAICMHCLKSIARDRLCWIETIKGPLLCCRSCSNSSYALKTFSNRPNLFDTLRRRCEQIFKSDSLFTTPDWTPNELSATLHQNHQVPGEVVKYIHGFTALPMDLYTQSAIYLRPEIEKVHQRYGDQLHSPHNITLVPSCLNKLHLTGAISLLPVVKNAMVLGLKEQELGRLRPRYHPDLEAEWAANEAAQDHQRIVCSLTPSNTKLRMRQECSPEIDQRIREMEKSGVWDGDLVPFVKGLFQTKSSRIQSPHWPVENMWQDTRWKELVALIKEMQGSKDWNPESNDIVWIGPQQDLPWFWREDHAPTDVDREWYWRFYSGEVNTIDTLCDAKHETKESPDTLLLHDARQYLINGGRCHVMFWKLTCRAGYLSSASKGRGTLKLMEDGTQKPIMPGEHMRSGWTNLQPTSLDAYDPHLLTIVTESVKANQYRYCYRGHPDILIPALRQVVLDLPDQCQWYGPVQKQYTPIKGCPIWRRTNPWYKGFCENRHVLTRKFQDAEDEEPDLGDDEEEAIQEMMDDLFAATRPSSDTATPFERLSLAKARIAKLDCGTDEQVQKMVENATSSVDDSDLFEQQLQELTTLLDRIDGIAERSKRLDALLDRADQLKCSLNEDVRTLINSVTNSINDQASCDQHLQSLSALLDKLGGKEQPPGSDPDMLPALRDLRNFVNLGQSCYASASLAMCMNLEKLHDFVMDENNERAKPDSQSGRTPHEWLNTSYPIRRSSTLPGATNPSTTSEDQIAEWSQKHMNNAKNLFGALRNLFTRMNNKGSRISQAEMKAFFDAVHALNPEEFHHNEQNDASVFLIELLQALTLVSDDSIKQKYRDAIASINTADGQNLQPVETDAMTRLTAKLQNGNDSALYILFCVQIATEYYCWSCKLVHRTFEHTPYLELNFIGPTGADQNLVTILQDWSKLSLSEPQKCLHNDSKLGTKTRIRRIVHAPQYLMIKFVRGNYLFMNHVDIPEFLDIRNCTTGVVLPSEIVHGIESAQQVSCIYRLTAVAMFIPTRSHYVAYVVKDRHWLAFDDLSQSPIPVREHPQTAINNGAVPYFTIYEQQPEKTSFPLDLADSVSPGFTLRKNGQVPSPKAALPRWNASDEFECLHLSNPCDKTFRTVGEARGHQHDQVGDDEQAASHL